MFEVFAKYLTDRITLSAEELDLIQSLSLVKRLRKRQYLLQEGDVWRWNAFVCKGCLRMYRVDNKGAEYVMHFAVEHWWTGDRQSLTTGQASECNIDALEDSVVLLISQEHFQEITDRIPAFKDMVNDILQKSFITSQNRIHANISFTAEEKYENYLQKYPDIFNRVPQHMVASYLGISPETLSRVRKQLTRK